MSEWSKLAGTAWSTPPGVVANRAGGRGQGQGLEVGNRSIGLHDVLRVYYAHVVELLRGLVLHGGRLVWGVDMSSGEHGGVRWMTLTAMVDPLWLELLDVGFPALEHGLVTRSLQLMREAGAIDAEGDCNIVHAGGVTKLEVAIRVVMGVAPVLGTLRMGKPKEGSE